MDFEVIEIIGDSRPYPALLSIDWAIGSKAVIDLKRRQMTFEDAQIRVIAPQILTKVLDILNLSEPRRRHITWIVSTR